MNISFIDYLDDGSGKINIYVNINSDFVEIEIFNEKWDFKENFFVKTVISKEKLTNENILGFKYYQKLFGIVKRKNIFEKHMGWLIQFNYPEWMVKLEKLYDFETRIKELDYCTEYYFDNENMELNIKGNNIKLQYNIILHDGVIEVEHFSENEFYNIENLPKKYKTFWYGQAMDIINEIFNKNS